MLGSLLVLGVLLAQGGAAQAPDTLPLALDAAVQRALERGDEALQAQAQVDLASAQEGVARAQALPQLRLTHNYTHVLQNARAQAVGRIFDQPNTFNVNANLSQPIFQGGRALAGWRAGARMHDAANLTQVETEQDAALGVVRAYLTVLLDQQLLKIQEGNLELAADRLQQTEAFEAAGRSSHYDVLRARVEKSNLEPQVIQARSALELAMLELKRLLNVPAAQPLRLTTPVEADAVTKVAAQVAALGDGVASERPALKAAELTAKARHDGVSVARAELFPTISVFLQTGYQAFPQLNGYPTHRGRLVPVDCPEGSDPGQICTGQNGGWFSDRSIGVQISWALFDGLRSKSNIDVAQAQARLADLQLQQERETVAMELATARAEFDRARAAFDAQHQNSAEAAEAFRLASLRYTRGLGTQLDVSDAQLALLVAETNEARATNDLYLAAAGVARALGRPLPLPNGGTIPIPDSGE